jgi:hypothetical protein
MIYARTLNQRISIIIAYYTLFCRSNLLIHGVDCLTHLAYRVHKSGRKTTTFNIVHGVDFQLKNIIQTVLVFS